MMTRLHLGVSVLFLSFLSMPCAHAALKYTEPGKAMFQALEHGVSGRAVAWEGASGRGEIYPGRAKTTTLGVICRPIVHKKIARSPGDDRYRATRGSACREENGTWTVRDMLDVPGIWSPTRPLPVQQLLDGSENLSVNTEPLPNGCRRVLKKVNRVTNWDIVCPNESINPSVEAAKRRDPSSFGGHASRDSFKARKPMVHQNATKCLAAEERMNRTLGETNNWFRGQLYSNTRHLTAEAATTVRDRLNSWSMRAMDYGQSIYRHRRQQDGEDGDGLCEAYIDKAHVELKRVWALVKAEAAKGNADLVGTDLDIRHSPYNN